MKKDKESSPGRTLGVPRMLVFLVFILSLIPASAAESRYFPLVMDGVFGDGGYQTTFKFVNTGSAATVRLEFFDNSGDPMDLPLRESESVFNNLEIELARGETISLRTTIQNFFLTGFARFTAPESVDGTASFIGTDLVTGIVMYEAAVPSVTPVFDFTVMIDSSGDWDTGLAVIPVVPGDGGEGIETELTVTLHDSRGESLDQKVITAAAGEKTSRYIYELFPDQGLATEMEGSVTVVSSRLPVAAISSRQRYGSQPFPMFVPTLTIYPVAPRSHALDGDERERIMVFAPHPDDEALACAGIIRRALDRGDEVRVVLITCGDANTWARNLLVSDYAFRAFDRDGDGDFDMLDYGILRQEETLSAMDELGLDVDDIVFLGYPDAGIDDLWRDAGVYTSPHTGAAEVPASYVFARSVGNPYCRDSILSDIKGVIREFRPSILYSPRDSDHHQDHWAAGRFVSQALTELREFRTWKTHYGYLVHWEANDPGWPHDGPEWIDPPGHAPADLQVYLSDSSLSPETKKNVINRYFSQIIAGEAYLNNFAKSGEIFWLEGFGIAD